METKVVIVEDEEDISLPLSYSLKVEGYSVRVAETGVLGLEMIRAERPHLVILDVMLPGVDGFEICRRMRMDRMTENIPIVMLTAKGEQADLVLGLGLGADDYVTKPFSTAQLLARLNAVLSRGHVGTNGSDSNRAEIGALVVDRERFEATYAGNDLGLTATEFRILFALAKRPDRVFRRDELLNESVGEGVYVIDRNIDVHMRSIRKKLQNPNLIKTIRGVGYRLESSEAQI